MKTQKLAIFDLDKTLANCNVSFAFGKFLYRHGHFSFFRMATLVAFYGLAKAGFLSLKKLHSASFKIFFYNKDHKIIEAAMLQFLKENQSTLFRPYILSLLNQAAGRGDQLWIQSSSPEFVVQPIAKSLGVHYSTATRYAVDKDGKFCSIIEIIDGETKRKFLLQFLQDNAFLRENVTAYSDSILDLPLLESVGTPVAVYPDKALRKVANERNWMVWDG